MGRKNICVKNSNEERYQHVLPSVRQPWIFWLGKAKLIHLIWEKTTTKNK